MKHNNYSKLDNPVNISIKTLYFAGKLIKEPGIYNWVPGWITGALGINGCAVGIAAGGSFTVYFNGRVQNGKADTGEIDAGAQWCSLRDLSGYRSIPCHVVDCPVRQSVMKKYGRPNDQTTCFPMADKKGFLMVCGDGPLLTSFPVTEILQGIAHIIDCSLVSGQSPEKALSYFLPSDGMAQMWSEMLAGLSHDLRTPLACIKGYATTLLREDVNWDPVDQKEFLQIIDEETDHIEGLINNLLDSSTLSWKGEIELKKEPVLLHQTVNKVLRDPWYQRKKHQFTVLFPEEFPAVEADPVRIEQVIRNLIDNAVKYSMENTRITIKGEMAPGEVIVSVTDQGIGIDEEHLNRLFEKFFRVSSSIQDQKGMGLGLPLARQIMLSHGGKIWAKSKLSQGTTFYFTLPAGPVEEPHEQP